MKVLHVSTSDFDGGAARAAYRLHAAQVASGIDSSMCVLRKGTADSRVLAVARKSLPKRIQAKLRRSWLAHRRRDWITDNPVLHTFGQVGANLVDKLNAGDADILNLHWISDMLSVTDIGRLRKPIVWTLHDMWPFCGGEHYAPDNAMARFRRGYRADNRPAGERGPDLNRQTWEAKLRAWAGRRFTIVSPSRWLAECAKESVLFADAHVHVVANPLDTNFPWHPVPQEIARVALGLPLSRRLILMGAMGGTTDPRKGGDLLREVITRVVGRWPGNVELLIYGQGVSGHSWPCPVHWLGEVRDDRVLAFAYAAADLVVVPSRQDNLPNAAVEAEACGTPVVAFDIGGLPDIVVHRATGWLAKAFNVQEMVEGILWILEDDNRHGALRIRAREEAVSKFSPPIISDRYRSIYQDVLAVHA